MQDKNTKKNVKREKKILIVGQGSYIGIATEKWLIEQGDYEVETVDVINVKPTDINFQNIDVVFHVAGIAHKKETKENEYLYYQVNRDLAVQVATQAKIKGVKQFIILSSMSIYGITSGNINKNTRPHPTTNYGKSKYEADLQIQKLSSPSFKVCIVRPPMVYGKGCKGNYQKLRKLALLTPIFPDIQNQRSMIFIQNLCNYIEKLIRNNEEGIFFPQNMNYVSTKELVKQIAESNDHRIIFTKLLNPFTKWHGIKAIEKMFGDLIYDCDEDRCDFVHFEETMKLTER